MYLTAKQKKRVLSRINKTGPVHPVLGTPCHESTRVRNSNGYVQVRIEGKDLLVHRLVWEIFYGCTPEGLFVLHKCDNPICVNPEHLWLGTQTENMCDKVKKSRQAKGEVISKHVRGERNKRAILTEKDVCAIRGMYRKGSRKFGSYALGQMFGVSQATIYFIVTCKSWKHI